MAGAAATTRDLNIRIGKGCKLDASLPDSPSPGRETERPGSSHAAAMLEEMHVYPPMQPPGLGVRLVDIEESFWALAAHRGQRGGGKREEGSQK